MSGVPSVAEQPADPARRRPDGARRVLARRSPRLPAPATPGEVVLGCRDVGVRHGGATILDSVALHVAAGEVVALVGPNGAGKSTLVSVLAGDTAPVTGTVLLGGAPLHSWSTAELAMRRAVLLQQVTVSFPFTVRQVVQMGRAPWTGLEDVLGVDDDEVVAGSMARTDVVHLADRVVSSLSGGERARAALARVLAQSTGILLLDEPTAALDLRHQEQVLAVARGRAGDGAAVVVVLHDLGLAAAHADRVVVLADGRVRAQGTPSEVLDPDLLSEVYECRVEVLPNPRTGGLIVVPYR